MSKDKLAEKIEKIFEKLEAINLSLESLIEKNDISEEQDISCDLQIAMEDEGSVFNEILRKITLIEAHIDED